MQNKNKNFILIFLFIFLFSFLIKFSMGTSLIQLLEYPSQTESNGTEFVVLANAQNFSLGNYAIMLSILNSTNNTIGQIYDPEIKEWCSSYYYLYNYTIINSSNYNFSIKARINPEKEYSGQATMQLKLKDSSNKITTSQIYNFLVIKNNQTSQNNTNSTNETNTTVPSSESYIEILDYPDEATFGEDIDLEFHVYKGDTGKYAIYIYVQNDNEDKVSEKIIVHAGNSSTPSKFKDYYFEEELSLDCLDDSGEYELIIEGLDVSETREIKLKKCKGYSSDEESNSDSSLKTEYLVENIESLEKIKIGEKIVIPVKIINNENFEKTFLIWSYIYNGPKCYSCLDNREENSQQASVGAFSEETIYLENTVLSAQSGDYNLKIKILKDELKTPKELTYPIYLENSEESSNQVEYNERIIGNVIQQNNLHATNEMKSKKSIFLEATPYLVSTLAMFFCIYLVVKKI